MQDLWNAIMTGDVASVRRALDRDVPASIRQARQHGEEARQQGWPAGTNPHDVYSREYEAWREGWWAIDSLARSDPRRALWEAQDADHREHRDLHDGNVVNHERPSEGSNL